MAHLQNKFPHLDFNSLVARLDPSVATFDPECLTRVVGSIQQNCTTQNLQTIPEGPLEESQITQQGPTPDLQPIFTDAAVAAAIHEYHRLTNEHTPNLVNVVRHGIQQLEAAFPYIDFPGFLQKATKVFPEIFDHVLSAAAPSTVPNLIG